MFKTIVTEGYVEKSEKGYLVEADFWGTVHSWDINDASFWSKDWKGCPQVQNQSV